MIYTNNYFRKELRHAYRDNKIGTNRRIAAALFVGLISFALFFVLQTLQQSVLADAVPEIMQPSYFSIIFLYIHLVLLFFTVYFIVYYHYLFFAEIRNNSWYLLIKMGYHPARMIFDKFMALLYSVFTNYTIGFVFAVFFAFLLKYTFIFSYLPSLFLVGLIDLVLITLLAMTLSLFTRTIINGRYLTFLSTVAVIILKATLGEYSLIANRVAMQNIHHLLDISQNVYFLAAIVIVIACCPVCLIRAGNIAKYYNLPADEALLTEGADIVNIDARTGKQKSVWRRKNRYAKMMNAVTMTLLIFFICSVLVFNLFIILVNVSTPGEEVAIRGIIPFVFKSSTMEPAIMMNDLAYFRKIDSRYPLREGQIILFEQDRIAYVERIIGNQENGLKVDIDNYPSPAQSRSMLKTVPRENVHGVYIGRSRWLGALILFANTIVGRLLFLLIPAVLLFYNKQITSIKRMIE
ncbi:S26 family signal peptidase [Dehalobacter sp. DCM]|uniref:S26 family signal peptidase n=1 Tax=Dehalobacter sp. DCM TaxID=2907827 RepID=UPI0030817AD2|nr:S26 family signal peptidase [Dehalobacter sp. DCM]